MRLFFIVPYAPTLIRTRPYNFLRALARRGHALTLATLWETEAERVALEALSDCGITIISRPLHRRQVLANAVSAAASRAPLQARYCWQPDLIRAIEGLLLETQGAFHAIHVEHLRGAEYARSVRRHLHRHGLPAPIVWDSVDCISLLFEQAARSSRSRFGRWMALFELPRTRRYEGARVREFPYTLTTSAKDQAALENLARAGDHRVPAKDVRVVPNGVDLSYFIPPQAPPAAGPIILSGKMSYHANVTAALHFVDDIMPRVWAHRPDTQVVIAGANPSRAILALAERCAPLVTVTGYVADLRPYLRTATIAVAPLAYGAGIQNKVLEAMACGVPAVVSRQASSALQAQPGRDFLVAESDETFADALMHLLEAPDRRRQLGEAGRAYVAAHHDWDAIASQLETIYAEAIPVAAL